MDEVDSKIIEELSENGRASYTEIGEKVGVSEGTVRNRVQKLEDNGIIEKFTVETSLESSILAFVMVNISTEREFSEVLKDLPKDLETFEVAGDTDLIVKISRQSSEEINDAVDLIRSVEGVKSTKTYMVLSKHS